MILLCERTNTFEKLCNILILLYIHLSKTLLEKYGSFGKLSKSISFLHAEENPHVPN